MRFPFLPLTYILLFTTFGIPILFGGFKGKQGQETVIQDKTNTNMDEYFKFGKGTTWTYKKTTTHGNTDNGMVRYNTFDAAVTDVTAKAVIMGEMALYVEGDFLIAGTPAEDGSLVGNLRVMKAGMKAGDTWDGLVPETSEEVKATFVGFEDLTLPAGKFKAAHIQYTGTGMQMDFWHVAKVGMVKLSIKTDNFVSEQVLQKYTIK